MSVKVTVACLLLITSVVPVRSNINADWNFSGHGKCENFLLHEIYNGGGFGNVVSDPSRSSTPHLVWKDMEKLLVQVTASEEGAEAVLRPVFQEFGFESTGCSKYICSGYLPMHNFLAFEERNEVKTVKPSLSMVNQAGSVVSEAFQSLQVDSVRAVYPFLNGTGIKVGIISDSFNTSSSAVTNYDDDIASGDLPSDILILKEGSGTDGTDEGRAMAQLIYDLVPDVGIVFYSGTEGNADFAIGIQELINAGE